MPRLLNLALMKNPLNWPKVFLMAVFFMLAFFLIADFIAPSEREA